MKLGVGAGGRVWVLPTSQRLHRGLVVRTQELSLDGFHNPLESATGT